jgi:hypothetical protein
LVCGKKLIKVRAEINEIETKKKKKTHTEPSKNLVL